LKFNLADLDLAADLLVVFAVGLEVDLGVILAVAQLAAWSEALECQPKKQLGDGKATDSRGWDLVLLLMVSRASR
jgi:hypothetical protein